MQGLPVKKFHKSFPPSDCMIVNAFVQREVLAWIQGLLTDEVETTILLNAKNN